METICNQGDPDPLFYEIFAFIYGLSAASVRSTENFIRKLPWHTRYTELLLSENFLSASNGFSERTLRDLLLPGEKDAKAESFASTAALHN